MDAETKEQFAKMVYMIRKSLSKRDNRLDRLEAEVRDQRSEIEAIQLQLNEIDDSE